MKLPYIARAYLGICAIGLLVSIAWIWPFAALWILFTLSLLMAVFFSVVEEKKQHD